MRKKGGSVISLLCVIALLSGVVGTLAGCSEKDKVVKRSDDTEFVILMDDG